MILLVTWRRDSSRREDARRSQPCSSLLFSYLQQQLVSKAHSHSSRYPADVSSSCHSAAHPTGRPVDVKLIASCIIRCARGDPSAAAKSIFKVAECCCFVPNRVLLRHVCISVSALLQFVLRIYTVRPMLVSRRSIPCYTYRTL